MELLIAFCKKYDVTPFMVFKLTYSHKKDYAKLKYAEKHFLGFCVKTSDNKLLLTKVPQEVEDYCLEVLAGRVEPVYEGKPVKLRKK